MQGNKQTFHIDQSVITSIRIVAFMCLSPAVVLIWAGTQMEGPANSEELFFIAFLLFAAFGMNYILVRKVWRKVPPNSKAGTLKIGPDGLQYDVGPYQRNITWSDVKTALPVQPKGRKNPAAIWLTRQEDPKVTLSFGLMVGRSLEKDLGKPIDRDDGIVIPTALFGKRSCQPILSAITPFLASMKAPQNGG